MPSNIDVPLFVAHDFPNMYKALFDRAVAHENMHGVFIEYAWDMGWCDPCAAQPLSNTELAELGAMGAGRWRQRGRQPLAARRTRRTPS